MKIGSWGIALDVPWNMLYWHSKNFKNQQKFEYEIKVQALKDTSWIKPRYLARFFCANSIKQPQLFWTNRRLLFCLTVWKKWVVFRIAGWMKNRWCRKWICCSNHILLKLNSVCSYIKRKWVSLNVQWSSGQDAEFPIQGFQVQNCWVAPRSTQLFILLRPTKSVPGGSGDRVKKSKLSTYSGFCSLETVRVLN